MIIFKLYYLIGDLFKFNRFYIAEIKLTFYLMSVLPACQFSVTRKREDNSCLLEYANEMRSKDWFNDTTVGVGTQGIPANRMVLACYSGYFEDKFLIKADYTPSVSITDMDEESVVKLIEFIYTKEITINYENILSLLSTAVKLKIDSAVQFCVEYFQSAINMENCYFILNEANLHKIYSLKEVAYKFMSKNFNEVSEKNQFKELSKDDLSSCISSIDRNKTSETFLYEAIIKWTNHNLEERKSKFSDLFLLLNLDQFSIDYLLQVVAEESLVEEGVACFKLVLERMTHLIKGGTTILSLGGNRTGSKVIEVFSLSKGGQKVYPDLPKNLRCHISINMNETIFCIGGKFAKKVNVERNNRTIVVQNSNVTNKVWKMDLKNKTPGWNEVAAMNTKRWVMGATVYRDNLVVAGGYDKIRAISSSEIYAKPLNKWETISPMNQARYRHCIVTCDDHLYVIGGKDPEGKVLSSVERLFALDRKWELTKSLLTPRKWFAAVCLKGTIFAIGGHCDSDDNPTLKSVEQFDPVSMTWDYVKDLNIPRRSHSACVLHDKIYVVGGLDNERNCVHEIECYDQSCDKWTIVGRTEEELCNHSLVVI